VGFRYTARPDSDGSRGEDFDGLFFSALSPEEGSVVRAGRLPDKLRFTRLQVGEVSPLPVFPYRRVRIQRDQGRGGLGHRSTV
jgi:hypothetical protein